MELLTKEEIEKIVSKINEGVTFKEWTEERDLVSEFYKDGEVYKQGVFLYQAIAKPKIFESVSELKKALSKVSICEELKKELESIKIISDKKIIKDLIEKIKEVHGRESKYFYEDDVAHNDLMAYEIKINKYELRIRDHQDVVRFQILNKKELKGGKK